jgi:hypothetical protein
VRPILKIPNTKRAGGVAQSVGPEFKPWYSKNKQTKKTKNKQKPVKVLEKLLEENLWNLKLGKTDLTLDSKSTIHMINLTPSQI